MISEYEVDIIDRAADAMIDATQVLPSYPGDEDFIYNSESQLQYAATKKLQLIVASRLLGINPEIHSITKDTDDDLDELNESYYSFIRTAFEHFGWDFYDETVLDWTDFEKLQEMERQGEDYSDELQRLLKENLGDRYELIPEISSAVPSLMEWGCENSYVMVVRNKRIDHILSYAESHPKIKEEAVYQYLFSLAQDIFPMPALFEESAGSRCENNSFVSWRMYVDGTPEASINAYEMEASPLLGLLYVNEDIAALEEKYAIM